MLLLLSVLSWALEGQVSIPRPLVEPFLIITAALVLSILIIWLVRGGWNFISEQSHLSLQQKRWLTIIVAFLIAASVLFFYYTGSIVDIVSIFFFALPTVYGKIIAWSNYPVIDLPRYVSLGAFVIFLINIFFRRNWKKIDRTDVRVAYTLMFAILISVFWSIFNRQDNFFILVFSVILLLFVILIANIGVVISEEDRKLSEPTKGVFGKLLILPFIGLRQLIRRIVNALNFIDIEVLREKLRKILDKFELYMDKLNKKLDDLIRLWGEGDKE